ncbi:MAG: carbon starvation protein A [Armatimonadota bacterium]
MNSLTLLVIAACCFALGYRYYSAFLAARVAMVDPSRQTPAHQFHDGKDYVPTNRYVLFGHHFAAISGAGPLLGPVLAAQWGVLPSAVWIVVGAVLAGAVHDFIILVASVRCRGMSLSEIAGVHIGPTARIVTSVAILFIIMTALAGLAIAVVNALAESIWGTFAIAATIPIALLVGLYLHVLRPGKVIEASAIGVSLVIAAVVYGSQVPNTAWGQHFLLTQTQLKPLLPTYGFIASVLPVWVLLCPRDYLSSYMKIGTIAILAVGIIVVHPDLRMPMTTSFIHGGGVVVPGKVWPFVCITIMCGAISGFHSLIGSGTTPKMINSEADLRFIGYGAMLTEAFVAITALIAASSLLPYDYFAINAKELSMVPAWAGTESNLTALTSMVREQSLVGRTGGAVSLAVGMGQIFSGVPGLRSLLAYWYHFAIVFEALFIMTALDTGTRVARFIVQEFLHLRGRERAEGRASGYGAIILTSALACVCWGYLLWGNDVMSIWPMFGIANQLLAGIALAIGTTYILRTTAPKYALTTALPMGFVLITALYAGQANIIGQYLPKQAYLNAGLTITMMVLAVLITLDSTRTWARVLRGQEAKVLEPVAKLAAGGD